jgi:hypothetical protein
MGEADFAEVDARVEWWRQGDCALSAQYFLYRTDPNHPLTDAAVQAAAEALDAAEQEVIGAAVLTQTCNIVRSCQKRPFVEVAPLVEVEKHILEEIRKGRQPRYAWIRGVAGRRLVADLDRVMTVEKAVIAGWERVEGCPSEEDARSFALALARHWSRFAFPDDFGDYANGLRQRISSIHDSQSVEGEALRSLREIRVRAAPSWDAEEVDLTFYFIREADDIDFRGTSWSELLDSWLDLLPSRGRFIASDLVVTLSDITAQDYVESDPLDLDHLTSAPPPS